MRQPHDEEWFFFDAAERALVSEVLDIIGATQPQQRIVLEGMLNRLRKAAELIRDSPSITASWVGGAGRSFSANSLIEQLCRVPDWDLDLHIPTKAVLGQAYLIAKINLLKALGYTLDTAPGGLELRERVEREVAQSIYTKPAEEPVISTVTGWFAELLAGAFFVEYIFGWQGIGKVTVDALEKLDYPVVMGSVLVAATFFILINILADILYGVVDPRVRVE